MSCIDCTVARARTLWLLVEGNAAPWGHVWIRYASVLLGSYVPGLGTVSLMLLWTPSILGIPTPLVPPEGLGHCLVVCSNTCIAPISRPGRPSKFKEAWLNKISLCRSYRKRTCSIRQSRHIWLIASLGISLSVRNLDGVAEPGCGL